MMFESLPQPVLWIVLRYLDVVSLCRLEQTCRWWKSVLEQPRGVEGEEVHIRDAEEAENEHDNKGSKENDDLSQLLWKPLFDLRFRMHSHKSLELQKEQPHLFKALYRQRHRLERSAYFDCLHKLTAETDQTRLLLAVTHFVALGRNAMDLLWRVAVQCVKGEAQGSELFPGFGESCSSNKETADLATATRGMYAQSFLRLLHCVATLEDLMRFEQKRREDRPVSLQPNTREEATPEDSEHLETLMILVSQLFYDLSPDLSSTNEDVVDATTPWIRQTLDDLADRVRNELGAVSDESLHSKTLQQIMGALHRVLFQNGPDDGHQGFVGNFQDYYNHRNSLLHTVLESRSGLPLTLAIIYQCVGRRVGLPAEIVGLPGHIVIFVPPLDRFVDVFAQGRLLTRQDCHDIVTQRYGLTMNPDFLLPLTPTLVLRRVCNNLENSLNGNDRGQGDAPQQRLHNPAMPGVLGDVAQRQRVVVTALRALLNRPEQIQLEECRNLMGLTWVADHMVARNSGTWAPW